MSIQDERDLRGRLGGLLDSLEAPPAPVAHAMRRGRVIRMRRWVSAVAGVAVLAAGAVALPKLIDGHGSAPMASGHYTVTVQNLGPVAKGGLIAAGTINNKHWRVVLDQAMGDGCAVPPDELLCGAAYGSAVGPREVNLGGVGGDGSEYQLGTVGIDVTRVIIRLSNGTALDLRPISAYGKRWIAVAEPLHTAVEAESFVGSSVYEHAVPYRTSYGTEFITWLRPGQPGLPRASAQVGSGNVGGVTFQGSVSIGPWGYCAAIAGGSDCIPTMINPKPPAIGKPLVQFGCAPLSTGGTTTRQVGAASIVMVPAGVKNLVLKFADGSHLRLVATYVAGTRVIGFGLPKRPKVVRALEYGFAGQLVGSTSADWSC